PCTQETVVLPGQDGFTAVPVSVLSFGHCPCARRARLPARSERRARCVRRTGRTKAPVAAYTLSGGSALAAEAGWSVAPLPIAGKLGETHIFLKEPSCVPAVPAAFSWLPGDHNIL